jgi:dienelactone hydrolase
MLVCAALLLAPAATNRAVAGAHADVGELGLLWLPDDGARMGPVPVVVALHDGEIDQRGWRYGEQVTAAGIAVLHLESEDVSADGFTTAQSKDGLAVAFARLATVLDRLAQDPRFRWAPVGLLAFGESGRAAMLAAVDPALGERIGALALLYPGCADLADSLGTAVLRPRVPVLLLHGDADPANPRAVCAALADRLARTAPVRHTVYAGAGYAWDRPPHGDLERVRLPWPHRPGASLAASFWPVAADFSAAQAASFFATTLPAEAP